MIKKMTALVFTLVICSLFGACSGNNIVDSAADNTAAESVTESTNNSSLSEKRFTSLEEYVDYVFGDMDEDDFITEYMTYTVYADNEVLVYDYTYNEQYDNVDAIKENLDAAYDPENESIQYLLSDLHDNVAVGDPKIKYIYRNNDGTVITEQIYE